jgi:hypothetical protein
VWRRAGDNETVASDCSRPVTLAELVATLSLVADLGMGRLHFGGAGKGGGRLGTGVETTMEVVVLP